MTEWRDIPGFEGKYQASSDGQIRSTWATRGKRSVPRIVKPTPWRGYHRVCLSVGKKKQTFRVHRLVLATFSGGFRDDMQVAHGNGIRTDNRIENLRWATPMENSLDRHIHGKNGLKLTETEVIKIKKAANKFPISDLAKIFGVSKTTIFGIKNNKLWRHADDGE